MVDEPGQAFSAEQAVRVQRMLRRVLGLEAEHFPLPAFIGMISDEIEQMRAAGHPDWKITSIILAETGQVVSIADLERHYAPAHLRRPPPE